MSIRLPSFTNSKCYLFTACSLIKPEKKRVIILQKIKNPVISYYKAGRKNAFINVYLPSNKSDRHIHVDCAVMSFIPKELRPKPSHELIEIKNLLSNYNKFKIEVTVSAIFRLPIVELPEKGLIRSLFVREKTGETEIKLNGGSFSISGAPISDIDWKIRSDEENVYIKIKGTKSEIFDDDYLIRLFKWIENNFFIFILSKTKNGK